VDVMGDPHQREVAIAVHHDDNNFFTALDKKF
jgi:hypothetical protein